MKNFRITTIIAFVSLIMLSGCGTTPAELKKQGTRKSYTVNESYQYVYRTIKQNGEECWNVFAVTSGASVSGEMYTDIKEAEVIVSGYGAFGSDAFARFDIRSIGDKKTSVTVYFRDYRADVYKTSESWFHGNKGCETN